MQLLLLRYTQALITQMAQTAVCNRHHSVDKQLCRWLLLSLDRLDSNQLVMTQELIANMLGVRREGVTEAAGKLQKLGVIEYTRGKITVLDRPGLEQLCCECYAVVKKETDRLQHLVAGRGSLTRSGAAGAMTRRIARPPSTPGVLQGELPVDQPVQYRLDVVGTAILVVEVVGVLPHVDDEERLQRVRLRNVGVGRSDRLDPATLEHEPGPAAAELGDRHSRELRPAGVDAAE